MILNKCNVIKHIEQVLAELDLSAIEDYVIIIIILLEIHTYNVYYIACTHIVYFKICLLSPQLNVSVFIDNNYKHHMYAALEQYVRT